MIFRCIIQKCLFILFAFFTLAYAEGESSKNEVKQEKAKYQKPDIDHNYINQRYRTRKEGQKAKIAIVFMNLGLDQSLTQMVLDFSPKSITMALTPYKRMEPSQIKQLKQQGHDVLLVLPTESYQAAESGQDPLRIRRTLTSARNSEIVEKVLTQNPHKIIGVINDVFSPAIKDGNVIKAIASVLKPKDLMFVNIEMPLDNVFRNLCCQEGLTSLQIDYAVNKFAPLEKLKTLFLDIEDLAKSTGKASLVLTASTLNIKETFKWLQTLDTREFELIPLSEFQKND